MKPSVKLMLPLMMLISLAATSCGDNAYDNKIDYLPVQTEQNGKWGMIDSKGELLFENKFEQMPSMAVNGYFTAFDENGVTVYKAGRNPEKVPGLSDLMDAGCMTEGRIPAVHEGQRIKYYDKDGNELFTLNPYEGKEIIGAWTSFYEGLAGFVNEDGKCGFINTDGEVVIKPVYDNFSVFTDGLAIVSRDSVMMVIDKEEKVLFKFKEGDSPLSIYKGKVSLCNTETGQWLIVDVKSRDVTKFGPDITYINWFDENYVIIGNKDNHYGLADSHGNMLISPRYDSMMPGFGNNFIVLEDGRASIVNDRGEETALIGRCNFVGVIKTLANFSLDMGSDFGGMGGTDKDVFLFNDKGERVKSFKTLGTRSDLIARYVISNYFNARSIASRFARFFNEGGFSTISIGQNPSTFMEGEPKDHLSEDTYLLPLNEQGLGFTIKASARDLDRYFVSTREIPDGYYYRTEYQWNPLSSIDMISATVSTKDDTYQELRKEFLVYIERQGWKMAKSEDAFCILKKDGKTMLLMPESQGRSGLRADIYSAEFTPGQTEEERAREIYAVPQND